MTREEAIEMMKAKLECMTRDVSGTDQMCNTKRCDDCDLCYAQGNMGEQKEWLRMGIEALENQKTGHWIELGCVGNDNYDFRCSECHHTDTQSKTVKVNYCWYCGAKMEGNNNE